MVVVDILWAANKYPFDTLLVVVKAKIVVHVECDDVLVTQRCIS